MQHVKKKELIKSLIEFWQKGLYTVKNNEKKWYFDEYKSVKSVYTRKSNKSIKILTSPYLFKIIARFISWLKMLWIFSLWFEWSKNKPKINKLKLKQKEKNCCQNLENILFKENVRKENYWKYFQKYKKINNIETVIYNLIGILLLTENEKLAKNRSWKKVFE